MCDMQVVAVELLDGLCEGKAFEGGEVGCGLGAVHSSIGNVIYA